VVKFATALDNRQVNALARGRFEFVTDIAQARYYLVSLETTSLDRIGKRLFGGCPRIAHRHPQRIDTSGTYLGHFLGEALLDQSIEIVKMLHGLRASLRQRVTRPAGQSLLSLTPSP